jgi:ParB-like chromosome segregation protein Spo0J
MEYWPLTRLRPYIRALRRHAEPGRLTRLIEKHGYWDPILATADGQVIDGKYRLAELAAMAPEDRARLGLETVPVIPCDGLTPAQVRALRLALNKSQDWAEWDMEALALELQDLAPLDWAAEDLGFTAKELTGLLASLDQALDAPPAPPEGNRYKEQYGVIVICDGEAHQREVYEALAAQGYKCRVVVT